MPFIQPLEAWGLFCCCCFSFSYLLFSRCFLVYYPVQKLGSRTACQYQHQWDKWRSPSYCCAYWRSLVLFLPHNSGAHVCHFCIKPSDLPNTEHPLLSMDACHFTILNPIFFEWLGLSFTSKWDYEDHPVFSLCLFPYQHLFCHL